MKRAFLLWLKNHRGATAIEYGLIAGAVGLAISGIVFSMGDSLTSIFQVIEDALASALAKVV